MKKLKIFLVFLVFLTASIVRLYKLDSPVADWHSWRQADTAAVARNFLKFGFDPLHPRYDDLSNIQSGKDNPQGYRLVEFPLYQLIGAGLTRAFGQLAVEVWLRLVNIMASSGTALLLALVVTNLSTPLTGIFAGLIYAILPYSIYYGRTILPETFAVFWAVLSLYLLRKLKDFSGTVKWAVLLAAAASSAAALLVKPTAIFVLLPAIYLFYRQFAFSRAWFLGLGLYGLLSLVPVLLWRQWILRYPEGIPVYWWLLNAGGIRFKGAWFYWLFAERLGKLILGYWGLIPFGLGLLVKPSKEEGWFFRWLLVGSLLYLIVFAAGNVQHDYYQIVILPTAAVYLAKGLEYLVSGRVGLSRIWQMMLAGVSIIFMLAFSWYYVRTYYWINRPEIVEAGKAADQLLPVNAKVIAPYNGDTTFLYQTNRQGWPIGFDIDKKIAAGATHYVTVSPTDNDWETRDLAQRYRVIVRNAKYAIIDLVSKPQ